MTRPPIDPLSDLSWARVEREVWSRLDGDAGRVPTRRRWSLAVGAVGAVGAVAAAAAIAIIVARGGGSRHEDPREDQVARVVTAGSPSTVAFDDVHLTLAADTAVVFDRDPKKPSAIVERGSTWFEVAPRDGRARFVVLAGDARIEVIGTRFRVGRSDERIEVEVDHGIVGVAFHGSSIRLGAGERWTSDGLRASGFGPRPDPEPEPNAIPAPPPVSARPTPDQDRARFEQLSALEVRDPSAAIAGYLAIAEHGTAWSELALYAAGRLAADRHDPRAPALLGSYLRRFPSGANVVDARELLTSLKGHP